MIVLKKNKGFTKSKGFTLVELIVVIAIIGILAAVLIPTITGYVKNAKVSSDEQKARAIYSVYRNYVTEVELEQTTKKFTDYYKDVTEKDLENFVAYTGNNGSLVVFWPHPTNPFPTNSQVINGTSYFIFDGNYAILIDAKTGDFIESGADADARAAWLN